MGNFIPYGLGRKWDPDDRDRLYPVRTLLKRVEPEEPRTHRYWWTSGWWGDQGRTPQCVGYAWSHWLEDGPVTQNPKRPGADPIIHPTVVYNRAQKIDEWPGENYDGTSVRAGAKVLQSMGAISSYWWATNVEELMESVLYLGPVVVGTWWHNNMFWPDEDGVIGLGGGLGGGHAYVVNGGNFDVEYVQEKWPTLQTSRGVFRIKNSWGRVWSHKGYAYISVEDMDVLLRSGGEVCIASELEL